MLPDLGLTTDVMVAFPGEGKAEFQESYEFVERIAFSRLHVFPYSKRPDTAALRLEGHLPKQEANRRAKQLLELGDKLSEEYHRGFLDLEVEVILERQLSGLWEGLTEEYVRVWAQGQGQTGQLRKVKVQSADHQGVRGILL